MTLEESYAYCERVARAQAKNFYYSFLLLSRPQRQAMCAIYAFMRYCDDLSDAEDVADRPAAIAGWQKDLDAALSGRPSQHPLWPAFSDSVQRYGIPHQYFHDMIQGVSSDLEPRRIQTFQELYDYCYHVASVVGLTIVHIFGFENPDALRLAERCGVAFQLTNILRDVREDAEHGRVYLPAEDLERFGVKTEDLAGPDLSPALRNLLAFEADRARAYYREAQPLINLVDRRSRASLKALIGIYARLLQRISDSGYDVLGERVRVPAWEKLWILARCAI
ncbi:MAG TPA: presqualene diphosphate synthase HpnD [Bryobacteraceae bacterium]|nr:presqualene diphosphate synthase HpnD [Bryobacteraceae bacterium]